MRLEDSHIAVESALDRAHSHQRIAVRARMRLAPGREVGQHLAVAAGDGIVMLELASVGLEAHQPVLVVDRVGAAHVGVVERGAPARLPQAVALHPAVPVHRHVRAETLSPERLRRRLGTGVGTLQFVRVDDLEVDAVVSRAQQERRKAECALDGEDRPEETGVLRLLEVAPRLGARLGVGLRKRMAALRDARRQLPAVHRVLRMPVEHQPAGLAVVLRALAHVGVFAERGEKLVFDGRVLRLPVAAPAVEHLVHRERAAVLSAVLAHCADLLRRPFAMEKVEQGAATVLRQRLGSRHAEAALGNRPRPHDMRAIRKHNACRKCRSRHHRKSVHLRSILSPPSRVSFPHIRNLGISFGGGIDEVARL